MLPEPLHALDAPLRPVHEEPFGAMQCAPFVVAAILSYAGGRLWRGGVLVLWSDGIKDLPLPKPSYIPT